MCARMVAYHHALAGFAWAIEKPRDGGGGVSERKKQWNMIIPTCLIAAVVYCSQQRWQGKTYLTAAVQMFAITLYCCTNAALRQSRQLMHTKNNVCAFDSCGH
jgi:hypothetical protein